MPVTEQVNYLTVPLQLVQRALPVSKSATLLECLAEAWLQASEARAGLVSLVDGGQLKSLFAEAGRKTESQVETTELASRPGEWSAAKASEVLMSMPGDCSGLLNSIMVVPFELDGIAVGGALLLGGSVDTSVLVVLTDISARLIEQFRVVAKTTVDKDSTSEAKLRDLKLEAMAEFAAGAGHEINNPVATIAGRSALLLKSETDPERRRILQTIGGQAYRIRDMIGDAMKFARPPEPVLEEFEPAVEIQRIADELLRQFAEQQVTLATSLNESIRLCADREQFRVVVSCLIRNSLETAGVNALIQIELSRVSKSIDTVPPDVSTATRFLVSDNGSGFSESEREHLFDPFFSGRQAGRGLGFGLSKCWQILRMHGGSIQVIDTVREESDKGVTIETLWPDNPQAVPQAFSGSRQ
ncbi:MAG: HAMP domain-containing sensor histidine kinase [Planctomycetota bacterium]|nr:HAMP domain-containing sensor histidine kinase [Planctomycetota bacterium]